MTLLIFSLLFILFVSKSCQASLKKSKFTVNLSTFGLIPTPPSVAEIPPEKPLFQVAPTLHPRCYPGGTLPTLWRGRGPPLDPPHFLQTTGTHDLTGGTRLVMVTGKSYKIYISINVQYKAI